MSNEKIRALILDFTNDIVFTYHGKTLCINPWNEKKFEVGYGDVGYDFNDIDDLMSAPILDGQSINQVAEQLQLS